MEELREVIDTRKAEVNLVTSIGKQMKVVKDLALKNGDKVILKFPKGEVVGVKVDKIEYTKRQGKNNSLIEKLYIKGKDGLSWNVFKAQSIKVVERNPRSRKVLTDDLKQYDEVMRHHLSKEATEEVLTEFLNLFQ